MTRKLLLAFFCTVITVSASVSILAHCGNTWSTASPTFGPSSIGSGCVADGEMTTITSKSVVTTIYWTVGTPLTVTITDSGQNKQYANLIPPFTHSCARCFPVFDTPQFIDIGGGVSEWRQKTWKQTVNDENECLLGVARGPITHHYGRDCTPATEEGCTNASWFWNPFSDSCQEEAPPSLLFIS